MERGPAKVFFLCILLLYHAENISLNVAVFTLFHSLFDTGNRGRICFFSLLDMRIFRALLHVCCFIHVDRRSSAGRTALLKRRKIARAL